MALLEVDEVQARAILTLQLRALAAMERQKLIDEYAELEAAIKDLNDILARPERQRQIVGDELEEIVSRYGDERRTTILPYDGEVSIEDLIAEEEVVVTITRGGYAKRTRSDNYRQQKRGGKGVRGAQLREDDIVDHFFVTTTHHWLLFFTNLGRVYRAKAYELPEGGRDAKGQHVANLLAFQPGEKIAQVLDLRDYDAAEYLVLATRRGLVKKTRLSEYNSPRSGGLIAINLREDEEGNTDELVSARLVDATDDLILVSRKGQSIRFTADDDAMRPLGRSTSGVTGMKFREEDDLLAMDVVRDDAYLFTVTEGGIAKRTQLTEDNYRVQGRNGYGIKVANLPERNGDLVGALVVDDDDEVLVIMERGKIVRSSVDEVKPTGRTSQGVIFAKPDKNDKIIAVARNVERRLGEDRDTVDEDASEQGPSDVASPTSTTGQEASSEAAPGATEDGR